MHDSGQGTGWRRLSTAFIVALARHNVVVMMPDYFELHVTGSVGCSLVPENDFAPTIKEANPCLQAVQNRAEDLRILQLGHHGRETS